MHSDTPNQPHVVYKFYTDEGAPLYIGSTNAPKNRVKYHQRSKPWFKQVVWIEAKEYPNRRTAAYAEYSAIDAERPRYNLYGIKEQL